MRDCQLYVLLSACEYMTVFRHVVVLGSMSLTCPSVIRPHSKIPIILLTFTSPCPHLVHDLSNTTHQHSNNTPTPHNLIPYTHNSSANMTDTTASTPNLTPREPEILFAMCKSFKSKPDVCNRTHHASTVPRDRKSTNTTVRPSRSTWNCSPPSPDSPPLAVPPPTSTKS
jgi:hypothetical protein